MITRKTNRHTKTIRLSCDRCFRDDCDGITAAELSQLCCKAGGWIGVVREQTYAQSIKVYDDPRDAPPGYSVMEWWTHRGTCPDCVRNVRCHQHSPASK